MATKTSPNATEKQGMVITRVFNAPRVLVWKAWTDPDWIKRWWGPKNFTAPVIDIDFREGGKYLYCMRSPEGKDYWSTGVFREIEPLRKIVATDSFADKKGNVVPASNYGMSPGFPLELLVTMTFADEGDKTRFTLQYESFPPGKDRDDAQVGWNETLDKLAGALSKIAPGANPASSEGLPYHSA